MHLYNKEQAIKRMNQLGQLHRPFIFIINYLQDVSYIEEVAAVDVGAHVSEARGFDLFAQLAHDDLVIAADVDTAQQSHVLHAIPPVSAVPRAVDYQGMASARIELLIPTWAR